MKMNKHKPKFLTAYGFPLDVGDKAELKSYKATAKRKLRKFKKVQK